MSFHQCVGSGEEDFNGRLVRVMELLPDVAGERAEPNFFLKVHFVELSFCIFGGEAA